MEQDTNRDQVPAPAKVGTPEGRRRARAKLDAARVAMTPEKWAALRAQVGLPAKSA